jgi:beta-lactamase regulating signal transducer with metallopeptidase domain
MNAVLKIFLSMSFSGGLLILALLLGKRFLKDKISRQWQYYIWLIVVLRLLLPFGPEVSLLGKTYQAVDQAITQAAPLPPPAVNTPKDILEPAAGLEQNHETVSPPAEDLTTAPPLQEIGVLLANHVWLIWLGAALGLLIRKVTVYQGFMRYIKAGLTPVSDLAVLDRLSITAERAGVQKPVELCVNPLISSPLLMGFFRPCIVLPSADISEMDFQYIVLHELTHYKRRDMFYKWLVQITVCLHWFNPLAYLMSWEITRACEFSCDEAVLAKMGCGNAQDYGKTLLNAMSAVGKYKENLGAVTLSENKQLLKERISAIMNFKKKSAAIRLLTGALTLCVVFGAAFVGVYPTAAAKSPDSVTTEKITPSQAGQLAEMETLKIKGITYYLVQNEAQLRAIGTGKEVAELLWEMDDDLDDKTDVELISVDLKTVAAGETIFLGEYTLSEGDEILYDISAKTGNRMKVFFAKDGQKDVAYWSVDNLRQPGESLECIADFIVGPPTTKPGTYKLYLQAPDGALKNVKGGIFLAPADAS